MNTLPIFKSRLRNVRITLLSLCLILLAAFPLRAGELEDDTPSTDERFGIDVSVFSSLDFSGVITPDKKLLRKDGLAADIFAFTSSISGTSALLGNPNNDGFKGAAYLYRNINLQDCVASL